MDKRLGNQFIVGIFVTIGLVSFIFLITSVGGGGGLFKAHHTYYTKFSHVKGLHYGSEVTLAGLRIGVVKKISIDEGPHKLLSVELQVESQFADKIRSDSMALVRTQGMLGDKYIELTIGSPELPVLNTRSDIRSEEEADLFAKSGHLVEGISKQFGKGGSIDTLILNLNRVALNLAIISEGIQNKNGLLYELTYGKSGLRVAQSMQNLDSILEKISKGEGTLGALINDPTIYEDFKFLLGGAKRSTILKYFLRQLVDSGEKVPKK